MIYDYDEFNLNEDMHIDLKRKLRDAVHDIMVDKLDYGEKMSTEILSEELKDKYNIKITKEILDILIFKNWWINDDYSIFKKIDKKWLDVWPYQKTVERKKKKVTSPLGKSRRKLEKEEKQKSYNYNYNYGGGRGGNYTRGYGYGKHTNRDQNGKNDTNQDFDRYYGAWDW